MLGKNSTNLGFGLIFCTYVVLVGGPIFSNQYMFAGDGYHLWSFWYLILYSIREFGELPWWDPLAYNGFPLYYHFLSGWFNILDPYYAPPLILFKALSGIVSINEYYIFLIAVYPAFLNSLAVYLIASNVSERKNIALLAPTMFLFSQYTTLMMHDPFAYHAITGPLFFIFGLVRFQEDSNKKSLLVLLFFAVMMIAGFHFGTLMSAIFWMSIFSLLLFSFSKKLRYDLVSVARKVVQDGVGKWVLAIGIGTIVLSVVSIWAPLHENQENVLRYRGQSINFVDDQKQFASSYWEPAIEKVGRLGLTWMPFEGPYKVLTGGKRGDGILENGLDYRYIGIASLLFGLAALLFGRKQSIVISLFMTFFIVNGFLVYTSDNLLFSFLREHSNAIATIRNTETILPRGGASIMLIILSVIGVDALVRAGSQSVGKKGPIIFLTIGLIAAGGLIVRSLILLSNSPFTTDSFITHSGIHLGIYLILFSTAGLIIIFTKNIAHQGKWCAVIVLLALMDGMISLSSRMGGDLSAANIWPHQWDARIPYEDSKRRGMLLPDNLEFLPFSENEDAMFPRSYRGGAYHNSREINSAFRDWLVLYNHDVGRDILFNWDDTINTVKKYPYFLGADQPCHVRDRQVHNYFSSKTTGEEINDLLYGVVFVGTTAESLVSNQQNNCEANEIDYNILNMSFNKLEVEVVGEKLQHLLFVDNFDRFWNVELDNQPAEIVRTNFIYKGVVVPAGKHIITWTYDPRHIRYLRFASLLALIVFGLMVIAYQRQRAI